MSQSHHLPREMVESILARLPVKSLLRFQAVSKPWKSIIWTPSFTKMRERVCRYCKRGIFLVRRRHSSESIEFCLADNQMVITGPVYEASFSGVDFKPLCSGNGVVLLEKTTSSTKNYVLLNPVTGMYKEIVCPYDDGRRYCGLCSDPTLDDFKILIVCEDSYFTYSCRNDIWSERREFIYSKIGYNYVHGWNGGFYMSREGNESREVYILSFDSRHDSFIMLPKIEGNDIVNTRRLCNLESRGRLYIAKISMAGETETLVVWKLEGRSWIKGTRDYLSMTKVFPTGWENCSKVYGVTDSIFFPLEWNTIDS